MLKMSMPVVFMFSAKCLRVEGKLNSLVVSQQMFACKNWYASFPQRQTVVPCSFYSHFFCANVCVCVRAA